MKQQLKIGTVEPRWTDSPEHPILGDGYIHDECLAFIYGAIKKYGCHEEYNEDLKRYILEIAEDIGK